VWGNVLENDKVDQSSLARRSTKKGLPLLARISAVLSVVKGVWLIVVARLALITGTCVRCSSGNGMAMVRCHGLLCFGGLSLLQWFLQ